VKVNKMENSVKTASMRIAKARIELGKHIKQPRIVSEKEYLKFLNYAKKHHPNGMNKELIVKEFGLPNKVADRLYYELRQ
jgi:hypothetical protein